MKGEFHYVYMLQSLSQPHRFYVGQAQDLAARLAEHNAGRVDYTARFAPWQIETAVAFRNKDKALAFERYLKSHSGRAFASRRF